MSDQQFCENIHSWKMKIEIHILERLYVFLSLHMPKLLMGPEGKRCFLHGPCHLCFQIEAGKASEQSSQTKSFDSVQCELPVPSTEQEAEHPESKTGFLFKEPSPGPEGECPADARLSFKSNAETSRAKVTEVQGGLGKASGRRGGRVLQMNSNHRVEVNGRYFREKTQYVQESWRLESI